MAFMEERLLKTHMDTLLNALRRMRDKVPCDCLLSCGQQTFHVHELILSACSPYLRSLLNARDKDEHVKRVDLPSHIAEDALSAILNFMYAEELQSVFYDKDLLWKVIRVCHILKSNSFFSKFLNALAELLSSSDMHQLIQLCLTYEVDGFGPNVMSHLDNKLCHLFLREDFLSLTALEIQKIRQYLLANHGNENELMWAINKWKNIHHSGEGGRNEVTLCVGQESLDSSKNGSKSQCRKKDPLQKKATAATAEKSHCRKKDPRFESEESESQTIIFFRNFIDEGTYTMTYDVENDKWTQWEEFPLYVNEDVIPVVHRQHIYLIGGYTSKVELSLSNLIYDYCTNMKVVVSTDTLRFPVVSGSAAVLHDQIYIVGCRGGSEREKFSRRVQRFDIEKRTSEEVAQTNEKYLTCKMYSWMGYVYIADKSTVYTGNLERYDPTTNQWTVILYQIKDCFHVAFSSSEMFVMGTYAESPLRVYELVKDVWRPEIKFGNAPNGVFGFWATIKRNRPVIVVQSRDNLLYIYDIKQSKWERKLHTPDLTDDFAAVVIVALFKESPDHQQEQLHPALTSLNSMRKYAVNTDVTLFCGQAKLTAHSFVLCAALPYFRTMLTSEFKEAKSRIISLPTVSAAAMERILTYLYTAKVHEDEQQDYNQTVENLKVSHLMEIEELYDRSLLSLQNHLNFGNFHEILDIGDLYDNQGLVLIVLTHLARNFTDFLQSSNFIFVSGRHFKQILLHPNLVITGDIKYLLEKFTEWYQHDPTNREGELKEFISILKLDQNQGKDCSVPGSGRSMMSRMKKLYESHKFHMGEPKLCSFIWLESRDWQSREYKAIIAMYDAATRKLLEPKVIPFSLVTGMVAVSYGSCIYLFGGVVEGLPSNTTIYKYCPFTNKLVSRECLKSPIVDGGAAVLGDAIFMVSGNIVQRFSPFTSTCDVLSNTNHVHSKPVVFGFKSSINVFSLPNGQASALEQYSPVTGQWSTVTMVPSYGVINSISVCNQALCMVVSRRFEKFLDYRVKQQGGVVRWSSEVVEDIMYEFHANTWSTKREERNHATQRARSLFQIASIPVDLGFGMRVQLSCNGITSPHPESQVLYTAQIQSPFSYPCLICPQRKVKRKNFLTKRQNAIQ